MANGTMYRTGLASIDLDAPYSIFEDISRNGLGDLGVDEAGLVEMLSLMMLSREFDARALQLQRGGKVGTFSGASGQEAVSAGVALAASKGRDWLVPAYRELPGMLAFGYRVRDHFLYFGGNPRGCEIPDDVRVFPISIALGTQVPQAVGLSWSLKLREDDQSVVFCFFGDGASSEGDVHEAMNLAGVLRVPVVFVIQNNNWALSTPTSIQTAAPSLASRSASYGMPFARVDGNDLFAVFSAAREARRLCLEDGQPSVIEAVTYRHGAHNSADAPELYVNNYLSKDEEAEWLTRDPIQRTADVLVSLRMLTTNQVEEMRADAATEVEAEWREAEATELPSIEDLVLWTYARETPRQRSQIAQRKAGPKRTGVGE